MKQTAPEWVPAFHCLAGNCRHTCCAGWEIDIDEETRERYRHVQGPLGNRLEQNIDDSEAGSSFRLQADERCPFLNKEGLCDLIIGLGEDSLCDICRDHPRYRNYLPGTTETGIGLCCEAACRLVLTWPEKMRELVLEDDGRTDETDEEKDFLRRRKELLDILQDRAFPVKERCGKAASAMGFVMPEPDRQTLAEKMLSLERLDDRWTTLLQEWADSTERTEPAFDGWELLQEQLAVASVHRHLATGLEDGVPELHLALAILSVQVIHDMAGALKLNDLEDALELCRMYSSQVEYSGENMDILLDWLEETIW